MIRQTSDSVKIVYLFVNKYAGISQSITLYVRMSLKGNRDASYKNLSPNKRSGIDQIAAYSITYASQAVICQSDVTVLKCSAKIRTS